VRLSRTAVPRSPHERSVFGFNFHTSPPRFRPLLALPLKTNKCGPANGTNGLIYVAGSSTNASLLQRVSWPRSRWPEMFRRRCSDPLQGECFKVSKTSASLSAVHPKLPNTSQRHQGQQDDHIASPDCGVGEGWEVGFGLIRGIE